MATATGPNGATDTAAPPAGPAPAEKNPFDFSQLSDEDLQKRFQKIRDGQLAYNKRLREHGGGQAFANPENRKYIDQFELSIKAHEEELARRHAKKLDAALDVQGQAAKVDRVDSAFGDSLRTAAIGGGPPSAAETQLKQGQEAAARTGMALAASARGGYNPAAFRAAQNAASQGALETNQNASALRAKELEAARAQYSQYILGERGDTTQRALGQAQINLSREELEKNHKVAMDQLALAKTNSERAFWGGIVNSVAGAAASATGP